MLIPHEPRADPPGGPERQPDTEFLGPQSLAREVGVAGLRDPLTPGDREFTQELLLPDRPAATGSLVRSLQPRTHRRLCPGCVGSRTPSWGSRVQVPVVVTVDVVGVAIVALAVWRRPRTWRCIGVFIGVNPLSMVPLGLERISLFGVGILARSSTTSSPSRPSSGFWWRSRQPATEGGAARERVPDRDRTPVAPSPGHRGRGGHGRLRCGRCGVELNALEQTMPGPVQSRVYIDGILAAARTARTEMGNHLDQMRATRGDSDGVLPVQPI